MSKKKRAEKIIINQLKTVTDFSPSTQVFLANIVAPTVHTNSSIHDRRCTSLAVSGRH
jgi:hypothetical protein